MNLRNESSEIADKLRRQFCFDEGVGYQVVARVGEGDFIQIVLFQEEVEEVCTYYCERWNGDTDIGEKSWNDFCLQYFSHADQTLGFSAKRPRPYARGLLLAGEEVTVKAGQTFEVRFLRHRL